MLKSSKMVGTLTGKKIVWAIDAFEPNSELHQESASFIENWASQLAASVVPVYVLNAAQLNLTEEMSGPWIEHYQPAAEKALTKILSHLKFSFSIEKPEILLQRSSSTTEATDLLASYAESVQASAIVVNSHGRSGVSRLFLGSFAETLLIRSSIPVLVLGAKLTKQVKQEPIRHLFFPSEFGVHSQNIFRRVVQLAIDLKAKLTLFHSVPHPIEPLFQSGVYLLGGSWIPVQTYFGDEVDKQKRHGEAWARWAEHQGVPTDFVLHSEGGGVAQAILDLVEKNHGNMIVMEEQSGPIAAVLLGSITRQVIRSATCPVLVVRNIKTAAETGRFDQKIA